MSYQRLPDLNVLQKRQLKVELAIAVIQAAREVLAKRLNGRLNETDYTVIVKNLNELAARSGNEQELKLEIDAQGIFISFGQLTLSL
jgi:ribose 1,5-bisphosphokinase PhnN